MTSENVNNSRGYRLVTTKCLVRRAGESVHTRERSELYLALNEDPSLF